MSVPTCPECVQGKHANCAGWAFDADDHWGPCMCPDPSHDQTEGTAA